MKSIELNFKGTYFWLLQVTVLEANSRIGGRAIDDDTSTFSTQSHIVIGCYNNPVVVMSKQVRYLFDYFMNCLKLLGQPPRKLSCWLRVWEVLGPIHSPYNKDVIKMVPVVPLLSTEHLKGNACSFSRMKIGQKKRNE